MLCSDRSYYINLVIHKGYYKFTKHNSVYSAFKKKRTIHANVVKHFDPS